MGGRNKILNVYSEIGKLKTVLLHRPGRELENLVPDYLERLLFDDIPYLDLARREHDNFAEILRGNGVEVLYLEDLSAEAITEPEVRNNFIQDFLEEGNVVGIGTKEVLKDYFDKFSNKELIDKLMAGVRKDEIPKLINKSLVDITDTKYPFVLDPMPNLYFTRDPFATIGSGITLNRMKTHVRNRETIFAKYIFENHPRFRDADIPIWFNRKETFSLEGGDILVLNPKVIAVGISARTDAAAIEKFAEKILYSNQSFETVLAFDIPKKRAFMHLDTVFTMVDYDKFTIHPEVEGNLTVYSITKSMRFFGELSIEKEELPLEEILLKYLDMDKITLIRCAGGNAIDAAREQWNDGSNTLAIAPGEVIVYARNYVTNKLLEEHGIKTHVMSCSELSRGRGGPRCMSMPLIRENL
ncbi:arginine deiminase [Proteiniborus sp.]|uniref:arginine deiminase n=1 Tax=Proteiniborus sp. TaxID=2079015 RepID=UPI003326460E